MKILFFSHYFPPEVNAPASRTHAHCQRWVQAGHDVTVITCAPNCPDGVVFPGYENRFWPQTETVDGIKVVRVWTYVAPNAGAARRIVNFLSYMASAVFASLFQSRPDIIIATSPQFFCGWAGVFASWLRWRPFVLEIRDIWPESISTVGALSNPTLLRFLEFLERRMYLAANHIVAVGNGYREQILEKVPGREAEISVITNGVDSEFMTPAERDLDLLEQYGLTGKFVISYIGTIGMAHGLEVVIDAARQLKAEGNDRIAFLLVGDGARRAELERMAADAGVSDRVVFPGRFPRNRMPAILASSDACLIHLRKTDLFEKVIPSKIFETMAMGRPMIMGVAGESREIVMSAGAGVPMEPDSVPSLIDAAKKLSEDTAFAESCAGQGRQFILREYNRDDLAARYLQLLERLAEGRRLPQSGAVVKESLAKQA